MQQSTKPRLEALTRSIGYGPFGQMVLYGLNGVANAAITYGGYLLLVRFIDYRAAVVFCFALGVVISYLLNGALVFRVRGNRARFVAVALAMLATNLGITWYLVEAWRWPKSLAQIPAMAVVFVLGFWINRTLVFASRPKQ